MRTTDGLAWLIVCVATAICLLDILIGPNFLPLREVAKPGKAIVLLLFSPVIGFLILTWTRQFPWQIAGMSWVRLHFVFSFFYYEFLGEFYEHFEFCHRIGLE